MKKLSRLPLMIVIIILALLVLADLSHARQSQLIKTQSIFMTNVAKFILYLDSKHIQVTGGELFRTKHQQAEYIRTGSTEVKVSEHQRRLAIDLNLFFGSSTPVYDIEKLRPYVSFWLNLHPGNYWGGDYKSLHDPVHFGTRSIILREPINGGV